jgi:ribosomal protein S18 acetylase RimI-like enzyme
VEATLEVRADNAGALALYHAHGFLEAGRRPRYYADGADAVLMTRPPGPLPRAS